ncbi:hypothetical protein MML61_27595 (plasmid) [Mycobacterium marinum]|uniref:hypothetical protein n=1 Tax=Mycobacterium marinum TaxID=1781 RepID=UPI00045FE484|nr:hypothetical protein [Mycobacterium marinum]WCS21179.1 hypothetical protein MML61_27595 [Mycobacterium marinum]WOR07536.1 hypothetical protein QDR78_27475 [Mycobacterium marinum]GJO56189.1 hypothetical protein NJB1604_47970 [Mycobacterium marinum]CDM79585.1 hypothetical protein MMARE11_p00830 [Mycobacterium marinum E11]
MHTVIAVVFIAIMRCIFTLMTVVIFLIQHPFASLVLSGLASATVIAAMRRCKTRRSQPRRDYRAAIVGPDPTAAPRLAAAEMSSARTARRCAPTLPGRCQP